SDLDDAGAQRRSGLCLRPGSGAPCETAHRLASPSTITGIRLDRLRAAWTVRLLFRESRYTFGAALPHTGAARSARLSDLSVGLCRFSDSTLRRCVGFILKLINAMICLKTYAVASLCVTKARFACGSQVLADLVYGFSARSAEKP